MRIVCGTDFTENAARGTTVAAALAGKLNDRLLLVHALPGGGLGARSPEVMNALFANLHEKLAEESARLGRFGAEVEPHLVTDYPEQAILSKVLPGETRLVVVGSQGRLASNHRLVGGVGERVAERSPLPTLVVAHVDWSPDEKARLGIPGPSRLDGNEPEVQSILERDFREKVNANLGDAGARIRVQGPWGRPDHDLIEIANQEQADLMVTGAHQRHGLERLFHLSVWRALLRHAPTSVLVVPVSVCCASCRARC